MVLFLVILLFVIGLIILLIKMKKSDWFTKVTSIIVYTGLYIIIFYLCIAFYLIHEDTEKKKQELEWCRETIKNNVCDGWDILIIDKYTRSQFWTTSNTFFYNTDYYVLYRYKMINGTDTCYYTRTDKVTVDLYDYYQPGKHYRNNCTLLTKDTVNN